MLKQLFEKEKNNLDYFFTHLDFDQAESFLRILADCKGLIFFTGVGKSGLVAKKIAMTMTSVGTRALYLSPTDALHGDIGLVSKDDVFVLISKSGETDELLHLIPYLRNKGAKLLALVCNAGSRLAKSCDDSLVLPMEDELCPYGLAPTISTQIQGIVGDLFAVSLMEMKKFSLDDYALNHPAGRIGKRITLRVQDLMLKEQSIPLALSESKVIEILVELSDKRAGCLLVVDDKKTLLGIFTDGDLRRGLQREGPKILDRKLSEVMTPHGRTIQADAFVTQAIKVMEGDQKNPIMVLPVVDQDRHVVGLLKMHDIIQSGI